MKNAFIFNNYSPKAKNCFSIITKVNIRENQRIDCQTFLLLCFRKSCVNEQRTRLDHMILQIDFTDKR